MEEEPQLPPVMFLAPLCLLLLSDVWMLCLGSATGVFVKSVPFSSWWRGCCVIMLFIYSLECVMCTCVSPEEGALLSTALVYALEKFRVHYLAQRHVIVWTRDWTNDSEISWQPARKLLTPMCCQSDDSSFILAWGCSGSSTESSTGTLHLKISRLNWAMIPDPWWIRHGWSWLNMSGLCGCCSSIGL